MKLPKNILGTTEVKSAMRQSVFLVWGDAQSHAPIEFGRLRGSIKSDIQDIRDGLTGIINSVGVDYASYLELGTRYITVGTPQRPVPSLRAGTQRPFMSSALHRNKGTILMFFKDAVRRTVK